VLRLCPSTAFVNEPNPAQVPKNSPASSPTAADIASAAASPAVVKLIARGYTPTLIATQTGIATRTARVMRRVSPCSSAIAACVPALVPT